MKLRCDLRVWMAWSKHAGNKVAKVRKARETRAEGE